MSLNDSPSGTNSSNFPLAKNSNSISETQTAQQLAAKKTPKQTTDTSLDSVPSSPVAQHSNSCNRCYKLKKKCTRTFPKCFNCNKAGEDCQYVERSNKRRKKVTVSENEKIIGNINQSTFTIDNIVPVNPNHSQVFHLSNNSNFKSEILKTSASKISKRNDKENSSMKSSERIILPPINPQHRQVSISSLLSNDLIVPTQSVFMSGKPSGKLKENNDENFQITNKLIHASWKNKNNTNNLDEEFLTMQPISNDLPLIFVNLFFLNFELDYPFLDKSATIETLRNIDFNKESIINFDTYLIMCIGCIIYDDNNMNPENNNHFNKFFNEKYIESIIDILNFKDLANVKLLVLLKLFSQFTFNFKLSWEISGIINRMVSKLNLHQKSPIDSIMKERVFWSVYNLDKTSSLILNKPSQLPDQFITHSLPLSQNSQNEDDSLELKNLFIELSNLQNQLNILKLSLSISNDSKYYDSYKLTYKTELESWFMNITKKLNYFKKNELVSLVNIHYNYLLIEFEYLNLTIVNEPIIPSIILQFLSNSYNLLTSNNYSISNINWLLQNLSVLNKSLLYLHNNCFNIETKIINLGNLNNFKNLLQLSINILIILKKKTLLKDLVWISDLINLLNDLNLKLMELNMISDGDNNKNSDDLIDNIYRVRGEFDKIMIQNDLNYN